MSLINSNNKHNGVKDIELLIEKANERLRIVTMEQKNALFRY